MCLLLLCVGIYWIFLVGFCFIIVAANINDIALGIIRKIDNCATFGIVYGILGIIAQGK